MFRRRSHAQYLCRRLLGFQTFPFLQETLQLLRDLLRQLDVLGDESRCANWIFSPVFVDLFSIKIVVWDAVFSGNVQSSKCIRIGFMKNAAGQIPISSRKDDEGSHSLQKQINRSLRNAHVVAAKDEYRISRFEFVVQLVVAPKAPCRFINTHFRKLSEPERRFPSTLLISQFNEKRANLICS